MSSALIGEPMPENTSAFSGDHDLLLRSLDCAVINFLHSYRLRASKTAFDTIRCPYFEGTSLYPGAKIAARTHVQWCVKNPQESVYAYFRPRIKVDQEAVPTTLVN